MVLSESVRAEIKKWMDLYPAGRQRSAILPALYVIQREFGYCRVDAQNELAEMLELEPAEVGAVVDFYHMFHTEPKGEYHVEVCTNVPCMLRGAGKCMHEFEEKLGIHHGETTAEAQLNLQKYRSSESVGDDFRQWEHVISFVQLDEFAAAVDQLDRGDGTSEIAGSAAVRGG